MCSLNLNSTINEQLETSGRRDWIEGRMKKLAFEADTNTAGPLDDTSTHRTRMPPALHTIRKKRIGRHRFWYSGHHSDCFYSPCFLVENKQGDDQTEADDDKTFQKHLKAALADTKAVRVLTDPKQAREEPMKVDKDAWKELGWYRDYLATLEKQAEDD